MQSSWCLHELQGLPASFRSESIAAGRVFRDALMRCLTHVLHYPARSCVFPYSPRRTPSHNGATRCSRSSPVCRQWSPNRRRLGLCADAEQRTVTVLPMFPPSRPESIRTESIRTESIRTATSIATTTTTRSPPRRPILRSQHIPDLLEPSAWQRNERRRRRLFGWPGNRTRARWPPAPCSERNSTPCRFTRNFCPRRSERDSTTRATGASAPARRKW